jgi:hypothetical protein
MYQAQIPKPTATPPKMLQILFRAQAKDPTSADRQQKSK